MSNYLNIRKVFGANVKFYRYQNDLTQEQLAEKCDLSTRYISDIENANGNVSLDTLEIIAKALNIESYILIKPSKHQALPKRVNMK